MATQEAKAPRRQAGTGALARVLDYWRRLDGASGAPPARLSRQVILIDLAERVIVTSVFGSFAYRFIANYNATANLVTLLLLLAESLPFIFVLLRAPSATLSRRPDDWAIGIMGSILPLLVTPVDAAPVAPLWLCFTLMLSGLYAQVAAKLVLGRAFGIIAANRGVRVLGPYRFVRHPMYAAYTLTHIGFLLSAPSPINAAFYAMALAFQIARIFREERVLMQDENYRKFARRVPYRLLPGVF